MRELYPGYSDPTLRSLLNVDEEKINYDLLERLVVHITEEYEEGAILVFLPGAPTRALPRGAHLGAAGPAGIPVAGAAIRTSRTLLVLYLYPPQV